MIRDADRERTLSYLEERFGVPPEAFEPYSFYYGSDERICIGPEDATNPLTIAPGMAIFYARSLKPTTAFLQAFGHLITRNRLELDRDQTLAFAKGEDMELTEAQREIHGHGYAAVCHGEFVLGCALVKEGRLLNMLPRSRRLDLLYL